MKLWFGNGAWASPKAIQRAESLKPEAVRKVAVIRHAALGDMILTRPFLKEECGVVFQMPTLRSVLLVTIRVVHRKT